VMLLAICKWRHSVSLFMWTFAYRVVISCNWLSHLKIPILPVVSHLQMKISVNLQVKGN